MAFGNSVFFNVAQWEADKYSVVRGVGALNFLGKSTWAIVGDRDTSWKSNALDDLASITLLISSDSGVDGHTLVAP